MNNTFSLRAFQVDINFQDECENIECKDNSS